MAELAAIVPKEAVETSLEALTASGRYDDGRRLEEVDESHVAIPIDRPVEHEAVVAIERGVATERRLRTLADHLRERGWTAAEIERAPSGYVRLGDIVLVTDPIERRSASVGEALLSMHGAARTVLELTDIRGDRRRPTVRHVAGERRTRTVHREHGVAYEFDLDEVMFSPGNQRERARMGEVVAPSERVVDLCAGIGYFALPMATAGARVTAIERNPAAFRWLSRNATRNGVDGRVTPIPGDCRATPVRADRAVVGHLPVHDCRDGRPSAGGCYLDAAVRALGGAGTLHVHGIDWSGTRDRAGRYLEARLRRRGAAPRSWRVRRVKTIAPRTDHVVVDVDLAGG